MADTQGVNAAIDILEQVSQGARNHGDDEVADRAQDAAETVRELTDECGRLRDEARSEVIAKLRGMYEKRLREFRGFRDSGSPFAERWAGSVSTIETLLANLEVLEGKSGTRKIEEAK